MYRLIKRIEPVGSENINDCLILLKANEESKEEVISDGVIIKLIYSMHICNVYRYIISNMYKLIHMI